MQTSEPEKKGGRKRSYTSEQLAAAIDAVRAEGRELTLTFVSKALSALLDISGTVRSETLAREIQAHVEAETQLREDTLCREVIHPCSWWASTIAAQWSNDGVGRVADQCKCGIARAEILQSSHSIRQAIASNRSLQ